MYEAGTLPTQHWLTTPTTVHRALCQRSKMPPSDLFDTYIKALAPRIVKLLLSFDSRLTKYDTLSDFVYLEFNKNLKWRDWLYLTQNHFFFLWIMIGIFQKNAFTAKELKASSLFNFEEIKLNTKNLKSPHLSR